MSPPQLPRDAPVLDVLQPEVVHLRAAGGGGRELKGRWAGNLGDNLGEVTERAVAGYAWWRAFAGFQDRSMQAYM